jgi:hypothetical protein
VHSFHPALGMLIPVGRNVKIANKRLVGFHPRVDTKRVELFLEQSIPEAAPRFL